jgi:hypothetical protein
MDAPIEQLFAKLVLLRLLNDLPENPSINESTWTGQDDEKKEPRVCRILQLKHEKAITQQLAFVCGFSDDPVHITAVCVEELRNGDGLTIRYAVNSGKHEVLDNGLQKVTEILRDEALSHGKQF